MLLEVFARRQRFQATLHLLGAGLEDPPDDHAGSRGDSRSAVGHLVRVRLGDFNAGVGDAERLGHDLGVHRARPLADLGRGHADSRAVGRQLERRLRGP